METSEQLYWITRLDSIQSTFIGLTALSVLVIIISFIIICINYDRHDDKEEANYKIGRKLLITSLICITISAATLTFTPSTKDAYIIYGVGGTIDYLKKNETARQLPDKAINALDKFIDTMDDSDTTKNN